MTSTGTAPGIGLPSPRPAPGRASTPSGLRYDPALDGLRALAVIAVLLYHGQVGWFSGGFLGVDLFFVLSGFLITSLLLAEHARGGRVDLPRFWARRARRLLPALFLVLLSVSAASAVGLLSSTQRPRLRWDSLATLAYVANWRFALSHQSYFAQYDEPSPLRHMWSLGIEEQYYLVFPLLLLGVLALAHGRQRVLPRLLAGGALASAVLMAVLFDPARDPSRVYYGTDTRAEALLVGAAAAAWLAHGRHGSGRVYLRTGAAELPLPSWPGLAIVGLVGFVLATHVAADRSAWLYRGGFLAVAVVCGLLIVSVSRAHDRALARRVLSAPPLVAVGLVSYGLYLWHWPVYVVASPERTGLDGPGLLALRLGVTGLLAWLSYRLVEHPIRRAHRGSRIAGLTPRTATVGAVGVTVAAILLSTAGGGSGAAVTKGGRSVPPLPGATSVFLIGDSVAYSLWFQFDQAMARQVVVHGSTQLGCGLMAYPLVVDGGPQPTDPGCPGFDGRWPHEVRDAAPDVAVLMLGIGEQFDREVDGSTIRFGTPAYRDFLFRELDRRVAVLGEGGRPVVLLTVPCHDVSDSGTTAIPKTINDSGRIAWLNGVQRSYAAAHPSHVTLVDLNGYLCGDGYTNELDGVQLRTDGLHFSVAGAGLVWRWLAPRLVAVREHRPG